jgi:hypothetical protein
MLNVLRLEPWVIDEQLRLSDRGALVLELYGHPQRDEAIRRIREAYVAGARRAPATTSRESRGRLRGA